MVRFLEVVMLLALCAIASFGNQAREELDARARQRIEQARASIVIIKMMDESDKTPSQVLGFFVRKDLIVTDGDVLDRNLRLQVTANNSGLLKVLSSGHYVLPYVLLESQANVSPLTLGDSERLKVNDSVYVLNASGEITAGKVTGTTTIKNTRAFLIDVPVDSSNKGAPVFNRSGEVIGIAAKSPDGPGGGLVWPSDLLESLKHLGEPGVGVGRGDGPRFDAGSPATPSSGSSQPRVDTKPVRLSTPMPRYTQAARANGTQGSVLLSVLVGEDGTVKQARVVRGLPDGLTEEALAVARGSKFKPAMKDGKPVPYWIGLEIGFTLR